MQDSRNISCDVCEHKFKLDEHYYESELEKGYIFCSSTCSKEHFISDIINTTSGNVAICNYCDEAILKDEVAFWIEGADSAEIYCSKECAWENYMIAYLASGHIETCDLPHDNIELINLQNEYRGRQEELEREYWNSVSGGEF